MSYNTLVNNIPITPKSLKEVKSTGLKDLKALCKDAGINIGGVGREALEILLCIELGIWTSWVDVAKRVWMSYPIIFVKAVGVV